MRQGGQDDAKHEVVEGAMASACKEDAVIPTAKAQIQCWPLGESLPATPDTCETLRS